MKAPRFSDSQIIAFLKQAEGGSSVPELCRELELNLCIKPKERIVREKPEALAVPETISPCWSVARGRCSALPMPVSASGMKPPDNWSILSAVDCGARCQHL